MADYMGKEYRIGTSVLLLVFAFQSHTAFADLAGKVVSVTDGDTINALHRNAGENI